MQSAAASGHGLIITDGFVFLNLGILVQLVQAVLASQELLADKSWSDFDPKQHAGESGCAHDHGDRRCRAVRGGTCLPPLDNRAAVRPIVFVMSIVPQLKLGVATKESSMPMTWRSPANA